MEIATISYNLIRLCPDDFELVGTYVVDVFDSGSFKKIAKSRRKKEERQNKYTRKKIGSLKVDLKKLTN